MRARSALHALLRVEWRAARRHALRSWLVVGLVAVCAAAVSGGGALFRTARATTEELRAAELGAAQLRVRTYDPLTNAQFQRRLPNGASSTAYGCSSVSLRSGTREVEVELWSFESGAMGEQGAARGMLRLLAGRAPSGPREAALSPALHVEFPASIELHGVVREVVGVVVRPEELERAVAWTELSADEATQLFLIDCAPHQAESVAREVFEDGHSVAIRKDIGVGDEFERLTTFVLGGFAFFEAALVIGATFAVGLRRRQREIGLIGANGAAVGDVIRAQCATTAVMAGLGAGLGSVLGVGVAFALGPLLDRWNGRWNGAVEISVEHILFGGVLGVVSATAAALVPAIGAARLPIVVALSGRRPIGAAARTWLALGVTLLALGAASVAFGARSEGPSAAVGLLGGSCACVLGLGASSPWLLQRLARLAAPLPVAWRLAARDAARFGARNGPVVTAVLAALSISVLLASLAGSVDQLVASQPGPVNAGADRGLVQLALFLSFGASLIVVYLATALAGAESNSDARALHAVGAPPSLLRAVSGARAAYLALLGALFAAPAGLAPSWGLVEFADARLEFFTPWPHIAACVVGLPTLAFLGAWLTTRRKPFDRE